MNVKLKLVTSVLWVLAATSLLCAQDEIVAVKAGQVLTVSGDSIRDAVVLMQHGKITAVGTDVAVPEGATVMDATTQVVMPGLVNAGPVDVTRGDLNEQSSEITPTFRISAAIDPASRVLKRLVQTGVTTLHVAPGPMNLIAGLSAVIKPAGKTVQEMMLKDNASLWITFGAASTYGNRPPRSSAPTNFYYRRPTTRMAVAWMVRKRFFDAQQYAANQPASPDPDLDVLVAAMDGQLPIMIRAQRSTDIRMALNIAQELDLEVTLFECTEGHKMAQELGEREIPVILEPFYDFRTSGGRIEGSDIRWSNAAILSQAGVDVAMAPSPEYEGSDLLTAACFAVRNGMSRDQALRGITLTPAEILGVADRVGSIETGKDADLLVLSGDPVSSTTRIERVIINGKTVYPGDRGVNK
ncbi:MAG: amidohydrolase family protein [Planctomycetes bacterium]|nr:amidohydrolase family protein [Planctomycetota bacterium]